MSRQSAPLTRQCQHRSQCAHDAIYGLYAWSSGETDVNLDKPVRVYCGRHKPRLRSNEYYRNVKLITRGENR